MLAIVKAFAVVLIVALAAQQLQMYYNIVLAGAYMNVAPIHLKIITGVLWPLLVVGGGLWLIVFIVRLKPSNFG
jgi:hypothetical protein